MIETVRKLRRVGFAVAAALLAVGVVVPALLGSQASAAQITTRSIKMESSAPSAATKYHVTFTAGSSYTMKAIVVDFCSGTGDPIVGDSNCSIPTGFTVSGSPTFTNNPDGNATVSVAGWTATSLNSGRTFQITSATGVAVTNASVVNFSIDTVTNSSTVGTFYARVVTYNTNTPTYVAGTEGAYSDYGGFALSTTSTIALTAKVYETLTFCVYTGSCGTAPALALGDSTTGALSSSTAEINAQAQYQLATNASHGVVVTMTGTTLCRVTPLNSTNCPTGASANTITSIGTTATAVNGAHFGTEQFGMCAGKNGSSALTIASAYNDTVNNCPTIAQATGTYAGTSLFGFDDNTSTGTNSTGGSTVMSSTGAVPSVISNFAFAANVAATTEAGIYQSNLNLVATGTF